MLLYTSMNLLLKIIVRQLSICHRGCKGSVYYNRANVRTKLSLSGSTLNDYVDSILEDYNYAILTNAQYARFNKGNLLALAGRFEDSLKCYLDEIKEFSGEKTYANKNISIIRDIVEQIGDSKPVTRLENLRNEDTNTLTPLVTVLIDVVEPPGLEKSEKTFTCIGSAGNYGNFGGGKGSEGYAPFLIKIVR